MSLMGATSFECVHQPPRHPHGSSPASWSVDPLWAVAAGLAAVATLLVWLLARSRRQLRDLRSQKISASVLHGKAIEQFVPLIAAWPWPTNGFRFLGDPIDGVQFTDDEVVLVEIKAGKGQLNARQRRVRDLVGAGRVRFEIVRVR